MNRAEKRKNMRCIVFITLRHLELGTFCFANQAPSNQNSYVLPTNTARNPYASAERAVWLKWQMSNRHFFPWWEWEIYPALTAHIQTLWLNKCRNLWPFFFLSVKWIKIMFRCCFATGNRKPWDSQSDCSLKDSEARRHKSVQRYINYTRFL